MSAATGTAPAPIDEKVLAFSIISHLAACATNNTQNSEKLTQACKLLSEVYSVSTDNVDDFKALSMFPATLTELVTAGCKATETETYSNAITTAQANPKYDAFVETVSKKGYFNGVDADSLEYHQRNAKVTLKFREKINASKPAAAASGNNDAAAEAKKIEGNTAISNKDYKTAVALYTDAINLSPTGTNAHIYYTNRAAAYCYLKDNESAVVDCKKAITLDPLYVKAHSRLGLANFFMNKYEEAAEAYERALELEPDNKALKDSLRQARQKVDERSLKANATSTPSSSSGAGGSGAGAGGMPDLAAITSLMGGSGGEGGIAAMMNNPQVMAAAQQMMQNPAMMQQAMAMMQGMGGGGAGGAGGAGGMPDMAAMAQMMQGMGAGAAANKRGGKK